MRLSLAGTVLVVCCVVRPIYTETCHLISGDSHFPLKYLAGYEIGNVTRSNVTACVIDCLVISVCRSVSFAAVNGSCVLHTIDSSSPQFTTSLTDDNFTTSIISAWPSVFLVGSCANNNCAPTQRCIPTVVVPTCEDLDCGRPPPPPKGYTRNIAGTSHGSLTSYTCSRYYIQANLSGPTIECLLNNTWSEPDYSNSLCRKPSSCEEVLQCQPAYTDGEYWLYPLHLQLVKDTKVKVYCHSMASGSPVEYITVDPTQNYGHNAGKDNGAEKVTAYFNKIRVNITNLQVIITDSTFASATYHYAAADDCRCNIGCPPRKGYFKVHTIGTGLKFGPLAAWYAHGWYPQIEHWYQSEDNTTFSANCGGYCGGCRPVDDTLPLIPNDQEVLPDNSAVVPSCA